jgi:hypothetical protein
MVAGWGVWGGGVEEKLFTLNHDFLVQNVNIWSTVVD